MEALGGLVNVTWTIIPDFLSLSLVKCSLSMYLRPTMIWCFVDTGFRLTNMGILWSGAT